MKKSREMSSPWLKRDFSGQRYQCRSQAEEEGYGEEEEEAEAEIEEIIIIIRGKET